MKTKVLLDSINKVIPATTKKGLLVGGEMIVIFKGELIAYNDRISVSTFVDDPGLDIECAINANDLKNVIKGIKESDVDLSMADNILSIVSEKTEAEIPVTSEIDTILDMIEELNTSSLVFTDLPDDFDKAIGLTRFNVSDDYNDKHNLFCLQIKNNLIYSADDFRLSRYILNGDTGVTCLIPNNNLEELARFDAIGISATKGWVHFINSEDAIFSCRTVIGDYPVNDDLFTTPTATSKLILPEELIETIESVTSLYNEIMNSHKGIKIEIKNGILFCEIKKENVWVKKELELVTTDVPDVSFTLSSIFLLDILSYTKEVKLTDKQAIFELDNFQHSILLQLEN